MNKIQAKGTVIYKYKINDQQVQYKERMVTPTVIYHK